MPLSLTKLIRRDAAELQPQTLAVTPARALTAALATTLTSTLTFTFTLTTLTVAPLTLTSTSTLITLPLTGPTLAVPQTLSLS